MKLQRIFIAINLPDSVKEKLLTYKEQWQELPASWTKKENLHLTLVFLGNMGEKELQALLRVCQEVGEETTPFELHITDIVYGPKPTIPRMIWAHIEKSKELLYFYRVLEKGIAQSEHIAWKSEKRPFSPHLTLARIKQFQLRSMEQEEIPQIQEEVSLTFQAPSFEIMSSQLKRSGAEYTILQSTPFSGS